VDKDRKIQKEIAMLNVIEVVLNVLVDQIGTISAKLPEAGDSGLHLEALAMLVGVLCDDERHLRPGAD